MLFSIPVHENQQIVNNQIENILKMNPISIIVLHIHPSFLFNSELTLTIYKNVYINPTRLNYINKCGLFKIHTSNFHYISSLNIPFDFFVLLSSNEMFIRRGLREYIEKNKNGLQIVKYNKNNSWHLFHRKIEDNTQIKRMLQFINLDTIYGGQAEGQFYERYVFDIITWVYNKFFIETETTFETEEIIPQTIFMSLNIPYSRPITLQNYCNCLEFTIPFIDSLYKSKSKSIIIPDKGIRPGTLTCPHAGFDSSPIFSIKRVDRNMNPLRVYITNLN